VNHVYPTYRAISFETIRLSSDYPLRFEMMPGDEFEKNEAEPPTGGEAGVEDPEGGGHGAGPNSMFGELLRAKRR
jgi:hypothetical protein